MPADINEIHGNRDFEDAVTHTITLEPTTEGYARIARRFSESILGDVKRARQNDSRAMLVQTVKIAAHLAQTDKSALARFIVALEQNERAAIMPESN